MTYFVIICINLILENTIYHMNAHVNIHQYCSAKIQVWVSISGSYLYAMQLMYFKGSLSLTSRANVKSCDIWSFSMQSQNKI